MRRKFIQKANVNSKRRCPKFGQHLHYFTPEDAVREFWINGEVFLFQLAVVLFL